MEFRAQDHHHHHHQDQMRSATSAASTLGGFSHQPSPAGSAADRRRSLVSAAHNGNNTNNTSTMTTTNTTSPSGCTNTQTLDARPLQQLHLSSPARVKYRECLKNHAASSGGSVFDGCGEFMPSGEDGSLEALQCAACSCHRNFHRKDLDGAGIGQLTIYSPGTRRSTSHVTPPPPPPPPPPHHYHRHQFPIVQPMNVAYGGGGGGAAESSSEELNATADNSAPPPPPSMSKKRFRTKFTQDQKHRMLEFAERVGWRFQKQDDELVEKFCSDVGVRRQVLKVWMHNNKSNSLNKTKHHLDHVSIPMGTTTAATDVAMNHQLSDDDEQALDH